MDERRAQQIVMLTNQMLSAIERDIPGDEWAHSFVDMYGRSTFEQIRGQGPEAIIAQLQAIPQVWEHVAPVENVVRKFIADVCSVDFDAEDEPEEPERVRTPRRSGRKEKKD